MFGRALKRAYVQKNGQLESCMVLIVFPSSFLSADLYVYKHRISAELRSSLSGEKKVLIFFLSPSLPPPPKVIITVIFLFSFVFVHLIENDVFTSYFNNRNIMIFILTQTV